MSATRNETAGESTSSRGLGTRRLGKRLTDNLKSHGWFAVGVDLVVVIVGILLALQVDGWAERREEGRLELEYLHRLKEDLEIERSRMDAAEGYAMSRIAAARLLGELATNPSMPVEPASRVAWALETASWRSFPQINAFVYHELQSTGRLVLLRSDPLRHHLAEHYTVLQHDARVGEDLSAQQRFDAATAGLLSIDEAAGLEGAAGDYREIEMSAARASELAQAFASRPAAVAELPGLVQHHVFNLRVIDEMRNRADALIREIDALLGH